MRVCVIGLRGLPGVIGGIEVLCERLYPAIKRLAPEIAISVLIRRGYTPEAEFGHRGVHVRALWSPSVRGIDAVVHSAWAILHSHLALSADVVHIHGIGPAFFTPLAKLVGLKVVVVHHAPDYERPRWGWPGRLFLRLGERLAARWADAVVCVSATVRDRFLALHPHAAARTTALRSLGGLPEADGPNRSPVLAELGLEPGRYVLAVGRVEATKAFGDLIAAFRRAAPDGLKLVVVGAATDPAEGAALAGEAGGPVVLAGFRAGEALRRLYEAAALFVHPSRMEGYGLVVAEALGAGCPVLVTDIAPHREFGLPEACHYPPGDVAALARALAVPDYGRYRCPAAAAAQRADSWTRVAREHVALLDRLMRREDQGPRRVAEISSNSDQ